MSYDSDGSRGLATAGILGGTSSESTREYYREIDEAINAELGSHNAGGDRRERPPRLGEADICELVRVTRRRNPRITNPVRATGHDL